MFFVVLAGSTSWQAQCGQVSSVQSLGAQAPGLGELECLYQKYDMPGIEYYLACRSGVTI